MKLDDLTISRATAPQLDAARILIQRAYRGEEAAASWSHEGELPNGERVSPDVLADIFEDAASIFSVATLGGHVVGTSLVEKIAAKECRIGLLSVDPDLQGHGIGDYLLRRAEQDGAYFLGAHLSSVEVVDYKTLLIGYYQRRGYRRTTRIRPYPHPLNMPAELWTFAKRLGRK